MLTRAETEELKAAAVQRARAESMAELEGSVTEARATFHAMPSGDDRQALGVVLQAMREVLQERIDQNSVDRTE